MAGVAMGERYRHDTQRARLVALATLSIALGAVGAGVALANTGAQWRTASAFTAFLVVTIPAAAGILALWLRAPSRLGYLLLLMAGAAFLASLSQSADSLVYSVGRIAGWMIEPVLAYTMLAYPSGRLTRKRERLIAGAFAIAVVLLFVPNAFLIRQYPVPYPWATCVHQCPANAFMVVAREPAFMTSIAQPVLEVTASLLFLGAVAAMWSKARRATPLQRRTLVPVMAAAIVHFTAYIAYLMARRAGLDPAALQWLAWLVLSSLPVFALSCIAGLLSARIYSARALESLTVGLNQVADQRQLRDLIAGAICDPSVELYYPDPSGGWRDCTGQIVPIPRSDATRTVSLIPASGEPLAAIAYDVALRDQTRLVEAVGACALTALARQGLTVALTSSRQAAESARGRMAAVAAQERHRIGRDLHDGAQQRLVTLRINLELAAEHIERDPAGGAQAVRALGDEVEEALEEIRSTAAGIFPPLLSDAGLGEALKAMASRSHLQATVKTEGLRRYPIEIETAAYYCCVEALQNSAKHARNATDATIWLRDDGRVLHFEVTDNGAGFLVHLVTWGSGLANMRDRLAEVGGWAWTESTPGRGTVVGGEIPIGGEYERLT
jgi:signal transduction histidine kinase